MNNECLKSFPARVWRSKYLKQEILFENNADALLIKTPRIFSTKNSSSFMRGHRMYEIANQEQIKVVLYR